jgi:hypothetical protein
MGATMLLPVSLIVEPLGTQKAPFQKHLISTTMGSLPVFYIGVDMVQYYKIFFCIGEYAWSDFASRYWKP